RRPALGQEAPHLVQNEERQARAAHAKPRGPALASPAPSPVCIRVTTRPRPQRRRAGDRGRYFEKACAAAMPFPRDTLRTIFAGPPMGSGLRKQPDALPPIVAVGPCPFDCATGVAGRGGMLAMSWMSTCCTPGPPAATIV